MKRISNTKRKYFKRIASFLAVICCLAGNILPAGLASQTVLAATPRVVFENKEKAEPYLYVSKELESAVPDVNVSDQAKGTEFPFTLEIGGVLQTSLEYTLFTCEEGNGGASAVQAESGEPNGPEVIFQDGKRYVEVERPEADPYRTDKDTGEFKLKDGQMARFYIGQRNQYAVSEVTSSLGEKFSLYRIEGERADTMGKSGKSVTFVNRWMPDEVTAETTTLEVEKEVIFPNRYDSPDALFPFQMELFGQEGYELYANQPYTVMEAGKADTPVVIEGVTDASGMAVTDEKGIFYLKDGCKAVFEGVPNKTQYRVSELLKGEDVVQPSGSVSRDVSQAGSGEEQTPGNKPTKDVDEVLQALEPQCWRLAPDTERVQPGVTRAPLTQNTFKNINAAFVVTKSVKNSTGQAGSASEDTDFTFLLTKEKGRVWAGAVYYLYDTAGKPVMENGRPVVRETGASDGKFTLKSGQAAVFFAEKSGNGRIGIETGTSYTVTEEPVSGFRQDVPAFIDTYAGMEVGSDAVNLHPFVNEVKEPGGLSVSKRVVNAKGEAPQDKEKEFKFVLMKKKADAAGTELNTDNYAPEANALYRIKVGGSIKRSGRTDENGYFTLKANETAEFDLTLRGDYYVQEADSQLPLGYWFDHVEWVGGSENQTAAESRTRTAGLAVSGDSGKTGSMVADAVMTVASDAGYGANVAAASDNNLVSGSDIQKTGSDNESDYDVSGSASTEVTVVIPPAAKKNESDDNDPIPFTLTKDDGMDITYYNKYTPDRTDLTLVKMNNETNGSGSAGDGTYIGEGEHLANAEFDLYSVERQTVPDGKGGEKTEETEHLLGHYVTTVDGLSIPDLASGTYRLKETKAPDGYMPMDTIEIEIERQTQNKTEGGISIAAGTVIIKVNGTPVQADSVPGGSDNDRKASNRKPCVAGLVSNAIVAAGNPGYADDDQLTVWAYDEFLYTLPHSGGIGIYWYLIGGVLLMMAAALILYKDKTQCAGRC